MYSGCKSQCTHVHMSCLVTDYDSGQLALPTTYYPKKSSSSLDVQLKRLSEQEKFTLLKEKIDTIERSLDAEVCRRQDGDYSLQAHVDSELHKLSERTSSDIKQLQLAVKSSVEQIGRSVHELNTIVSEEREQRKVDIDHVGTSLCERINEVIQTVDEERFSRLEQERQSLKRCGSGLCDPARHQSPQRTPC
jgi:vacuolar-type H+-ATPase subunit I/STV1